MKKENIDLPDVQEFLKLSRILVRQMQMFNAVEIPAQFREVIDGAIVRVHDETKKYRNVEFEEKK